MCSWNAFEFHTISCTYFRIERLLDVFGLYIHDALDFSSLGSFALYAKEQKVPAKPVVKQILTDGHPKCCASWSWSWIYQAFCWCLTWNGVSISLFHKPLARIYTALHILWWDCLYKALFYLYYCLIYYLWSEIKFWIPYISAFVLSGISTFYMV